MNIPKHWEIKKLGEVCKCVTGTTPSKNDLGNYGNYIPFVKPPQLFDTPINNAPEKLSSKGAEVARVLPINSVLVTCIGNLGRTALNTVPVAFNQQINAIIPPKGLNGRFLFYQAQSPNFKNQLEGLSAATTVAIVNKGKFETINIVYPPLQEQQAIVAKIEELLSDLENGKQQLLKAQQQLKVYRQSLLKWAFEGKLTNKNVKEGELPKKWTLALLGDISEMCLGKMLDKSKNKGTYKPYLRNISVRWGYFDLNELEEMRFEENEEERYSLKKGDLIICEGGEPGRCAIWNEAVPNMKIQKALHRVRVGKNLSEKYLYYFMFFSAMSGLLEKYFTGTTIKHLTGRELKRIEIPLPPLSEQQQIVEILESKLTVCDKLEETISQSLTQSETLRQSILKRAFEGRLV
ncbi:MAG: restriction endonuclease subunit S [Spirosomataceae bacterium]